MKYLIVGLGNPGAQYQNTRHNIGFKVLDELAGSFSAFFTSDRHADICEINFKGRILILVKPTTFMNLSGKAVNYWMQKVKVKKENVLIITDDISLPFGTLRLRKKGDSGGHNGLKDIQIIFGDNIYSRLRFGVGNDYIKGQQANYVLGEFCEENILSLKERIEASINIIKGFSTYGVDRAMSEYNGK